MSVMFGALRDSVRLARRSNEYLCYPLRQMHAPQMLRTIIYIATCVFLPSLSAFTTTSCFVPYLQSTRRGRCWPQTMSAEDTLFARRNRGALVVVAAAGKTTTEADADGGGLRLMKEVRSSRAARQTGLLLGGTFLSVAVGIGLVASVFDPVAVLCGFACAVSFFVANTLSYDESSAPLPDSFFGVRESEIANAGKGLFSKQPISGGTFLMKYGGEALSETEYFRRYPDGQGRYVAEIPEPLPLPNCGKLSEPTFIDGNDASKSNLARYMNSKTKEGGANVAWKKQRFGTRAMNFYAIRDIEAGEELCFDYGANYWDAMQ